MLKTVANTLFFCLFTISTIYSEENTQDVEWNVLCRAVNKDEQLAPLAELEGEPSATVHGCVNAISGQLCMMNTDLTVYHGVTPLNFERSYAGSSTKGSFGVNWNMNHAGTLSIEKTFHDWRWLLKCVVHSDHGNVLFFRLHGADSTTLPTNVPFNVATLFRGISNTAQGCISGQTYLKNNEFLPISEKKVVVKDGSGRTRLYSSHPKAKVVSNRLDTDTLPCGNRYTYDYIIKKKMAFKSRMNIQNTKGENRGYITAPEKYSCIRYFCANHQDGFPYGCGDIMKTNDGRWALYAYSRIGDKGDVISHVTRSDGPEESYNYNHWFDGMNYKVILIKKSLPESRYLKFTYLEEGHNQLRCGAMNLNDQYDPRIGRVKAIYAPAGTDDSPVLIYEFDHQNNIGRNKDNPTQRVVRNGYCDVTNALNHRIRYEYDANLRLSNIFKYNSDGSLECIDRMNWESNESHLVSCIRNRYLEVNGSPYFAREYQYDNSGNVLIDSLYGNLSGTDHTPPRIGQKGWFKKSTCECYKKHQEYSTDGFNLLIMETDGILTTRYIYEPESNRIAAKYTEGDGKILRRWFYRYNKDAAVTYECTDDGCTSDINDLTSVTERRFTYLTQSDVYPAAYPLVIEEKCLDLETGEEKLIHKVTNTYTNLAKVERQSHYDSNNVLRYTLEWDYDPMGNIIREVNAIGETITRKYDANCNLIEETGPNPKYTKIFSYDFMNRLIKETEYHPDNITMITSHRYDIAGNKLGTIDPYGNETQFTYDAFGRVIQTIFPAVLDENGIVCTPITKKEYEPLGKVSKEIDAHGIEKQMSYTIRGQISECNYPDGTSEKNVYNLNGSLAQITSRSGTVTKFEHDPLGRPFKTEIFDSIGNLLSVTTSVYSGFKLMEETDAMGIKSTYTYFPDGKMKTKSKEDRTFLFEYDALGRLIKSIESCDKDSDDQVVKILDYDLLDRVIEEATADGKGTVLSKKQLKYDVNGNICEEKTFCQAGESIHKTTYDTHGTAVIVEDSIGNKTVTQVRYDYFNSLGQKVPYSEVTDPMGMISVKIGDALGHIVETIKKNPYGKVIQQQLNRFDAVGNLCMITDRVILPDDSQTDCVTLIQYDTCRKLKACYEALGTPEQKQTKFTYNAYGQKESLIKNDGTTIFYTYDALGRQSATWSSDKSFDYEYTYDLDNHPLCVVDRINNTTTERRYDRNGYLKRETLATGLIFEFDNDNMGRVKAITLPDKSGIRYAYSSAFLRSVARLDSEGMTMYSHTYEDYDQSGAVIQSKLAVNGGSLNYQYDLLSRLKNMTTETWKEEINIYDPVGNIVECTLEDSIGRETSNYTYDELYQLKSESGLSNHTYSYDSHYNRRSKDGRRHQLNSLHQLIDDGIYTYTYDANGNMKEKTSSSEHSSFDYDALDRLIRFTKGSTQVRYSYDENNRRLSKTFCKQTKQGEWKDENKIIYLYQGQNEIGVINEKGKITELRLIGMGKGAEIGAAVAMELEDHLYIPLHDHIGNVCCLLDGTTGEPVETYRYSSFGEELFESAISPWRYASKRTDPETGFVYFGRRYYDASIGRWISPDPIGREGGINLYAYVLNSPLTHFDLYGLFGMQDYVSSGLNYCMQKATKFVSNLLKIPGHTIAKLGYHLVPIPYVKDVIEFCGHCLTGKNPSAFVPAWKRDQSQLLVHEGYGSNDPNKVFVLYNGICTTEKEMRQRMAKFSEKHGGVRVFGVYNGTQGASLDTIEVMCQKLGIPTSVQQVAEMATQKILDGMGEYKETATIIAEAHSQGAETVHNLSAGLRHRMDVTGIGPARILRKRDFKDATNLINRLDLVPLADVAGLIGGLREGSVQYLPTSGCPFKDHLYDSKNFGRLRAAKGNDYISRFGEVL